MIEASLITKSFDTPPFEVKSGKVFNTQISAQSGSGYGIISFAFYTTDKNNQKGDFKLYPVKFCPVDYTLVTWEIGFYNDDSQDLVVHATGIETIVRN